MNQSITENCRISVKELAASHDVSSGSLKQYPTSFTKTLSLWKRECKMGPKASLRRPEIWKSGSFTKFMKLIKDRSLSILDNIVNIWMSQWCPSTPLRLSDSLHSYLPAYLAWHYTWIYLQWYPSTPLRLSDSLHSYLPAYLAWQYNWIYLQICSIYSSRCNFVYTALFVLRSWRTSV